MEGWKRKPPLAADPRASEGKKGVDRICPSQHTLPAGHLTIECRMVEQKREPPLTNPAPRKVSEGKV